MQIWTRHKISKKNKVFWVEQKIETIPVSKEMADKLSNRSRNPNALEIAIQILMNKFCFAQH